MIQLLIGNIACGKSTYAKKKADQGWIIINDDAIVNAVHANIYTKYRKDLKPLYKAVENQIVMTGLAMKENIVVDRGVNLTPKSRKRFIALAHSFDSEIEAIVFPFLKPEIHAHYRSNDDLRGFSFDYWQQVAEYKQSIYIEPQEHEQFDRITFIDDTSRKT